MDQVAQTGDTLNKVATTVGDGFSIVKSVTAIVASVVANPIMSLIVTGVIVAVIVGIWAAIKAKLKQMQIDAAKRETTKNEQEQIETRIPQNQKDGEDANESRRKIDEIK